MIRAKYTDINYNGMNENKMKLLTGNYTNNPFDNSVVIIDEAHNFVSRVVNKLKQPKAISYRSIGIDLFEALSRVFGIEFILQITTFAKRLGLITGVKILKSTSANISVISLPIQPIRDL